MITLSPETHQMWAEIYVSDHSDLQSPLLPGKIEHEYARLVALITLPS